MATVGYQPDTCGFVTNGAWLPILQQHGPALIEQCENAEKLASRLATEWLEKYMLADREDRKKRAAQIVRYFVDHHEHQSHALGIDRDAARKHGVVVCNLERDQRLQDAVLSVHHAALVMFMGAAVKIIENHEGIGFFKLQAQLQLQLPAPQQIRTRRFSAPESRPLFRTGSGTGTACRSQTRNIVDT